MMKTLISSSLIAAAVISGGCTHKPELTQLALGQLAGPPDTMAISILNYLPQTGKNFKDLFVSNFSVKASKGALSLSTARDGLPDDLKQAHAGDYGMTINSPYSINSGFSDLLLFLMGVSSAQQSFLNCGDTLKLSTSNDAIIYNDKRLVGSPQVVLGLRDCEKLYLGLNAGTFDNSGNGIPDYLKLRCGLNPKSKHDANLSISGDGVSNYDKCKQHIPVDENANSQPNHLFAYKYQYELHPDGTQNLNVSNIPILNGGQDNLLAFYVLETDAASKNTSLYTAYAVLKAGSTGKTLKFNYWATDPAKYFNQEIIPQ